MFLRTSPMGLQALSFAAGAAAQRTSDIAADAAPGDAFVPAVTVNGAIAAGATAGDGGFGESVQGIASLIAAANAGESMAAIATAAAQMADEATGGDSWQGADPPADEVGFINAQGVSAEVMNAAAQIADAIAESVTANAAMSHALNVPGAVAADGAPADAYTTLLNAVAILVAAATAGAAFSSSVASTAAIVEAATAGATFAGPPPGRLIAASIEIGG